MIKRNLMGRLTGILAIVCSLVLLMILLFRRQNIVVQSEADAFFLLHPESKKTYVQLDPTSIKLMSRKIADERITSYYLIDFFRKHASNDTELLKKIDDVERTKGAFYDNDMLDVKNIERIFNEYGGQIYVYELSNQDNKESGFLVISKGEIVGKAVVEKIKQAKGSE